VPPEFGDRQEPFAGGPLPLSPRHALSLADCYFVLALLHDSARRDASRINPFGCDIDIELPLLSDEAKQLRFWFAMASHVATLRAGDQVTLDDCLAQVVTDLGVLANPPVQDGKELCRRGKGRRREKDGQMGPTRVKIIAALTKHHQYANGSCLNTEPIGVNKLARLANVAPSSVTAFFKKEFGREKEPGGDEKTDGHRRYQILCCRNAADLVAALKLLNGEYSPRLLFRRAPAGEAEDYE
jgi:hypothetical protein